MTTSSNSAELEKRKRGRGRPTNASKAPTVGFAEDFRAALVHRLQWVSRVRFPSARYQQDPAAFFREILGFEAWSRQLEVLEAVRDHPRVAVASGHKVGKSRSAAGLALWFYCSYEDARVIMTSVTARQVDQILWRELSMVLARSGRCVACKAEIERLRVAGHPEPDSVIPRPCEHSAIIEGRKGDLARTGFRHDFREIVGFTAREAEAVAGISGTNLLYLLDEASGIPREIYEAIEGNRAGGARIVMFSNPTKNEGEFFEAFYSKSDLYKTIRISSEESPNVLAGRAVIPGLAERAWIEEKKAEWGAESALYKVRVKGEHALHEDGRIFSIHAIAQAEQRWADTPESGRLYIGVDPAGESGTGDDTGFALRRGQKVLSVSVARGLDDEAHLIQVLALCLRHKLPREVPVVVVDAEGSVGSKVWLAIRNYAEAHPGELAAYCVRASDKSQRQPHIFDRQRDALVANLEEWVRNGGALPEDVKLEKELHAFEWIQQTNGRLKVTSKIALKKLIGRSPDRFDAVALSVWEPLAAQDGMADHGAAAQAVAQRETPAHGPMDPYSAGSVWEGRR